nr:MAG TPA: hypothetical protein [Ackermannviridae sp.]
MIYIFKVQFTHFVLSFFLNTYISFKEHIFFL